MPSVLYLRQSLDRGGMGAAVTRQREDCLRLAASRRWKVVGEYIDNDVSASSVKPRPQFEAMLGDAEAGGFDSIVVWHADRLARRPVDLERLVDLAERRGIRVATVFGDLDLTTDSGRLVARILVSVARAEVERKGARQRRAQTQAAQLGKPASGPRPVGYEADGVTVRTPEAKLIRQGYKALLAGASLRSIARQWNAAGFRSTRGGEWRPDSVRYVLKNARNAGLRSHRGEIVGPGSWKALVSEDQWRAAVSILDDPERRTALDTRRKYLLASVARCGLCGSIMATGRTQHGVRTYKCAERSDLSRGAEGIDEYVTRVIVARLSQPDAVDLLVDDDREDAGELRVEAKALRTRLADAADAYSAGQITLSMMTSITEKVTAQLADVEARMAHTQRAPVLADLVTAKDVRRAWDRLDLERQRAVVQTLCNITLLSPGRGARRLDPDSIEIDWHATE